MATGDSDEEGDLLPGMMSPPNGFPSVDQALSKATSAQAASIQVRWTLDIRTLDIGTFLPPGQCSWEAMIAMVLLTTDTLM